MINKISTVVDTKTYGNASLNINEYSKLQGSKDIHSAKFLDAAQKTGMKLRYVSAHLDNSTVNMEPGLLHYMQGNLDLGTKRADGSSGIGGFLANKVKSKLSGESSSNTVISGTGVVVLEPTFGHILAIEMNNEEYIADKGIYSCSIGEVNVDVAMQKNISSALFGGEGLFQTLVKGSGIAVFNSPVHLDELVKVELNNDTLKVDGSFAILRSASLEFTAEKSAKSFYGTLKSGEGILQTFRGTGTVWLAPTESFYAGLGNANHVANLAQNKGSSGDKDVLGKATKMFT